MNETRDPDDLRPHPYSTRIFRQRTPSDRFVQAFAQAQEKPLVITTNSHFTDWPEDTIIDGHRRWLAAIEGNLNEVEVRTVEYDSPEREKRAILHQDDNRHPTFSQKMRLAEEYEAQVAPVLLQRMEAGKPLEEIDEDPLQNFAEGTNTTTRGIVADRLGWSGEKLRQAWKVWERYQDGDQIAKEIVRDLDSGDETVYGAFKRYRREQQRERIGEQLDAEGVPIVDEVSVEALPSPISPFPYPGSKRRFVNWIVSKIPKHERYIEPFGGAASVLLSKPPSEVEVYNDIDPELANFFEVLRDDVWGVEGQVGMIQFDFEEYESKVQAWHDGKRPDDPTLRAAYLFFERHSQYGGKYEGKSGYAGDEKESGLRRKARQLREFNKRLNRNDVNYFLDRFWPLFEETDLIQEQKNIDRQAFTFFVESVLNEVEIQNDTYERVIRSYDSEDSLFYFDPPYRGTEHRYGSADDFDHDAFVEQLVDMDSRWILSYGEEPPAGLDEYRSEVQQVKRGMDSGKPSVERIFMNYGEEDEGWFLNPEKYPTW